MSLDGLWEQRGIGRGLQVIKDGKPVQIIKGQETMSLLTSQLYRIIVPKFIRKRILAKELRTSILKYYAGLYENPPEEIEVVLDYLRRDGISVLPYSFQSNYIAEDIEVHDDKEKGLRYVLLDGKRLYFKRRWSVQKIRNSFNELSKEQDPRSPHRYLNEDFQISEGETLIDIGVAEGNFALMAIEKVSRAILFETDVEWIEALNATFEPWKEKVLIVNKFVSNVTDTTSTRLDDFIPGSESISFIKIDVDGAESKLLDGCKRILTEQKPLKVALCTYHKQNDEQEFTSLLTDYGFETSHSDGFILFYYDKQLKAPYLRRGLIRAVKRT